MKKIKKVILISSSSGGHALPVFHIYKELKQSEKCQVTIYCSGSEIEKKIFGSIPTITIIAGKFDRNHKVKNIFQSIKTFIGLIQSLFLLVFYRPDLIFSKGGFCSFPVLTVARMLGIPYFIHESDSSMGLSNKIFVKEAKKVFVGFPLDFYENEESKKFIYSGLIIQDFRQVRKVSSELPKIFVTGGSQGAQVINQAIIKMLPRLLEKFSVIHQVGDKNLEYIIEKVKHIDKNLIQNYDLYGFSLEKNMESLVSADLIISRAGATTIGEIAKLNKPSILIPYKYASSNHQVKNSRYLEKTNSAIIIREENFNIDSLYERIRFLFSDKKNLEILGSNINRSIKTDGLKVVTDEIINF